MLLINRYLHSSTKCGLWRRPEHFWEIELLRLHPTPMQSDKALQDSQVNHITVKITEVSPILPRYKILLLLHMFLNHKKPLKVSTEVLLKKDYMGKTSFEDVAYSILPP